MPLVRPMGYQRCANWNEDRPVLLYTLIDIVGYLISIVVTLVIVQFIMSLLLQFNVINAQSDFVAAIWRSVNALLDPDTGIAALLTPAALPFRFGKIAVCHDRAFQ